MQAKDALKQVVESCHMITRMYIEDLQDSDLLVRSVPGTNHIAWQLGHMIVGNQWMIQALGCDAPKLDPQFVASYTKETAASDDPARFAKKSEYLSLIEQMKAASLAAIDATPESKLDDPAPESLRSYAPTVGSVLMLTGTHWLMHAGQFVPIRRKLGKAPIF